MVNFLSSMEEDGPRTTYPSFVSGPASAVMWIILISRIIDALKTNIDLRCSLADFLTGLAYGLPSALQCTAPVYVLP